MNIGIPLLIISIILLYVLFMTTMRTTDPLTVYHVDKKERLGNNGDGGYVIATLDGKYDLYIGCGISNETSFDEAFCSKYPNIYGFAFDGTLDIPPKLPEQIKYVPMNIDSKNSEKTTNLTSYMKMSKNIFMKMDIEGSEWEWLNYIDDNSLSNIKQLVIEIHWLFDDKSTSSSNKKKALEKLSRHFYLVHVHGNNCCGQVNESIPYVLECTYIRKDQLKNPSLNKIKFPTHLDFPNLPNIPDINLHSYPFVH